MSANPFTGYVAVKVGNISPKKLERTLKGLEIRLSNADLSGDRVMLVHPQNARLIKRAKNAGKGLSTQFTPFEALADLNYHEHAGGSIAGGSLWSWLKNKAYPWVKQNWGIIKPILGKIADVAIPAAATALGAPQAGIAARAAVKSITGVSVRKSGLRKGSEEAKKRMAELRSQRKSRASSDDEMDGGSFRMP
jgi:hypothetical protein